MDSRERERHFVSVRWWWYALVCGAVFLTAMVSARPAAAACQCGKTWPHLFCHQHSQNYYTNPGDIYDADEGGSWHWSRSPEQERRVVMNLYNRYCIRCHGVDGRGVWDIPDVPDFTNNVWQTTRPDAYRARVLMEGRGAVMPSFRGTLTLEESWAMARYLHTFVPGDEESRTGLGHEAASAGAGAGPAPAQPQPNVTPAAKPAAAPTIPPPVPFTGSPFNR
jgi:Cytochrome C oxidase, cbb3-type, subunit III